MRCQNCGKENPPDALFCNRCSTAAQPSPQYQTTMQPQSTSALKLILIILAGFVVLGVISWNAGVFKTSSDSPSNSTSSTSVAQPQITLSKYNQLQDGMTYSEVVKILGKPGTEVSSSSVAGYKTVMIQWEGEGLGANMNAMFQNGKLISKAQLGLK